MTTKDRPLHPFRTTVLIILSAVLAAFVLAIFLAQRATMWSMLTTAEEYTLTTRIESADNLLMQSSKMTSIRAEDIASWDVSRQLARAGSLSESSLNRLEAVASPQKDPQIGFVLIKNLQGDNLLISSYDVLQQPTPISSGFSDLLSSLSDETIQSARAALQSDPAQTPQVKSGIVFYKDTPYYISFAPIYTAQPVTGVYGAVIVGNILSESYFREVTQFRDFSFSLTQDEQAPWVNMQIERVDDDTLLVTQTMPDIYGNSARFEVRAPRTAYQQGFHGIMTMTILLIVLFILFLVILYFFINRLAIRPIERLSKDVHLATSGQLDPMKYSPTQEFASLCEAINDLVRHLNDSKMSLNIFDHILNGMNVFLYVSDPNTGEVIFINDKMLEHFHIEGNVLGKPCWTLLENEGTNRCAYCPLPELVREPERVIVWEELNTKTGHHYRNTDSLIDWIDGRRAHLHYRVDITDIKQAEETLKQRLKQQQIMSDISRGFIETSDADAFIISALRTTGEFVRAGRTLITHVDPQTHNSALVYEWANAAQDIEPIGDRFVPYSPGHPIYDAIVRDHAPYALFNAIDDLPNVNHLRHDGVKSSLSMPIMIGDVLWGVMSVAMMDRAHEWTDSDIHLFSMISSSVAAVLSRKASEEVLLRMSSISESSPNYIAYVNPQGEYEYINAGAEIVTGYPPQALRERGMQCLFDDAAMQTLLGDIFPRVRREGQVTFEMPITRRDGERRLLSISAFTIESHPDDIGTIATDITEQRQMESDLIAAKEEAERSNHAKSDFLSRMSHEMRTPMNAIIGMTNMAHNASDIEKKDYCLDKIDEASTHLLGVINDILDMSKIEANKFELSYTEFDFERMLQKITNIMAFRIDEKHQTMIVDIDHTIPSRVIGDEQRLAQVITNLLSNANKFTPEEGSIRLSVEKLEEAGDSLKLEFTVTDSGIGITPEQQSRLFRAFEQADGGVSRKFGGTGLGLAISKRIVEMMGGEISVRSVEGEGASFIFSIQVERGSEPRGTRTAGLDLSRLRVLAVDDAQEVRDYFASLSARFGFACDTAATGEDAALLIESAKTPYDIAFVDWKMPGMDGIELTRRIKALPDAPTSVIMISAAEWNEVERLAQEAGVDKFIAKPLFASVIMDCINQAFGVADYVTQEDTQQTADPASQAHYEGYTILLAEDIEINREIVLSLLEPTGVTVDEAENGVIAYEKFKADPDRYDLIFMDIHMPDMDGYEATRQIRALDIPKAKAIPIVAMTANVFREDIERCLAAGMNDHIGKPIDVDEFFTKLRKNMPEKHA